MNTAERRSLFKSAIFGTLPVFLVLFLAVGPFTATGFAGTSGTLTMVGTTTLGGTNSLDTAIGVINGYTGGGTVSFVNGAQGTITFSGGTTVSQSANFVNNVGTTSSDAVTVDFGSNSMTVNGGTLNLGSNLVLKSIGNYTVGLTGGSDLNIGTTSAYITSNSSGASYAILISGSGNIHILGDCAGTISTVTNSDSAGIYAGSGSVSIGSALSGVVTSSATGTTGNAFGIYAFGDVSIGAISSGGSISAISASGNANGIHSDNGNGINILGDCAGTISTVASKIASGINASSGSVSIGGTLSGVIAGSSTGTSSDSNAFGIYSNNDISIGTISNSGRISATSVSGTAMGIFAEGGTINIGSFGGTISASGSTSAIAIYGFSVNTDVLNTAMISATSTGGTAYAIYTGSTGSNSIITMHSGCTIIGNFYLSGSSDTLTLASGAGSTTLSGSITGAETLNVTGGYWNLMGTVTGVNNFSLTGGTLALNGSFNVGTITVQSGATLGGTGTFGELINNGTVAPGNSIGTLHVTGNYTNAAGSNVNIQIDDAGNCDKIAVGGNATIQGGTVNVQAAAGNYSSGMTYRFLTASVVNGTFSGVTDDLAFLDASLVYGSGYVAILLTGNNNSYDSQAATPNQHAVARCLDANASGATGDFKTVLNNIDTLSGAGAREAYDAMGGDLFGSIATIGLETNDRFLRSIAGRLQSQSLANGFEAYAADNSLDKNVRYCSLMKGDDCPSDRWSTWVEGFGAAANLASDGNANGLNYSTGGVLVGVERRFNDCTKVGLVGGYSNTFATQDDDDTASIDGGQIAAFLHRDFNQLYFTGIAAYGYNSYATTRQIEFAEIDRTAHANYGGNNFSFYNEIGRTLYGRYVHLQPYAALEYINVRQNAFTETGADSIDIASNGETADAFRGLLGSRVFSNFVTDAGRILTIEGRAAWRHEFLDESRVLDAAFAGVSGSSFAIAGMNVDRDMAILGLGTTYHVTSAFSLFANYDALTSENYTSHTGSGGMQVAW